MASITLCIALHASEAVTSALTSTIFPALAEWIQFPNQHSPDKCFLRPLLWAARGGTKGLCYPLVCEHEQKSPSSFVFDFSCSHVRQVHCTLSVVLRTIIDHRWLDQDGARRLSRQGLQQAQITVAPLKLKSCPASFSKEVEILI